MTACPQCRGPLRRAELRIWLKDRPGEPVPVATDPIATICDACGCVGLDPVYAHLLSVLGGRIEEVRS